MKKNLLNLDTIQFTDVFEKFILQYDSEQIVKMNSDELELFDNLLNDKWTLLLILPFTFPNWQEILTGLVLFATKHDPQLILHENESFGHLIVSPNPRESAPINEFINYLAGMYIIDGKSYNDN